MGQHTPGGAGAENIKDGIDDFPAGVFDGSPAGFGRQQQGFQELPFDVVEVGVRCSVHNGWYDSQSSGGCPAYLTARQCLSGHTLSLWKTRAIFICALFARPPSNPHSATPLAVRRNGRRLPSHTPHTIRPCTARPVCGSTIAGSRGPRPSKYSATDHNCARG